MKIIPVTAFLCLVLTGTLPAAADVKARIIYDRTASIEVMNPSVQERSVILPQGTLPFSRISRIDFEFDGGLTEQKCGTLFSTGDFGLLEQQLNSGLKQVAPFAEIPGNLDAYLLWQMKVQFWNGRYAEMNKTAGLLQQRGVGLSSLTAMYAVLAAVEQKQTDEAEKMFAALESPDAVSAPMALFVRARLAMAKREYSEALQHLASVAVLYSRDAEWMPAATLYEGLIYKRTGYHDAAGNVAKDLIENWPVGYWARRSAELE